MQPMYYRLNEDFVASDVVRWYHAIPRNTAAVIAVAEHPSVQLYRRPNEHVYWCTDGCSGLTVSLDDAQQRLAMFQSRWRAGM